MTGIHKTSRPAILIMCNFHLYADRLPLTSTSTMQALVGVRLANKAQSSYTPYSTCTINMANASPFDSTETLEEFTSLHSKLSRDDRPIPVLDEMSPLLRHERSQGTMENPSGRWHSAASAFVERNTGLLLVAGSQLFFSVGLVAVKWLTSLDEPVPILEVCAAPTVV
jgi:hypothetical protein